MIDFNSVAQATLSPQVTLPVIAALTLVLGYSMYDSRRRVRATKVQAAKMILVLMKAAAEETNRRVGKAIEFTYDTIRDIGFDKFARSEVTIEDVIFGGAPNASRHFGSASPFTLDELKEALGGKPRYTGAAGDEHAHFVNLDDELVRKNIEVAVFDEATHTAEDAAGLEGRAHFSDRSPRAG
jgi:hypothetical protein